MGEVSLEDYAAIAAAMAGSSDDSAMYAVAATHGLDRQTWDQANEHWRAELSSKPQLTERFHQLYRVALGEAGGPTPEIDFETYVAINVALRAGDPQEEVFAAHQLEAHSFSAASYRWMDELEADRWLNTRFALRVRQGLAQRKGLAPREDGVYGPVNLVRSRRCPTCGALKLLKPRTAYIYCDYCATLFDYEIQRSIDDPAALDPSMVDDAIDEVTFEQLVAAHRRGDRDEYARICTFKYQLAIEVCPAKYSPRTNDPDYRRRFIHELMVPWAVATQLDEPFRQALCRAEGLREEARIHPNLKKTLALLEASREMWSIEASILESERLFDKHPDQVDKETFRRANHAAFARPWLAALNEEDQRALLAEAGLTSHFIEAPKVNFADHGCGQCGGRIYVPDGSQQLVCEHCGFVLQVEGCSFPCAECGAPISMPDGLLDVVCGFCSSRYVR